MGAKVPLMVAQVNKANNATDETLAKAVLLRALGWRFLVWGTATSRRMKQSFPRVARALLGSGWIADKRMSWR